MRVTRVKLRRKAEEACVFLQLKKGKLEQILIEKRENRFLSKLNSNENSIHSHENRLFAISRTILNIQTETPPHFLTLINFRYIQNKRNQTIKNNVCSEQIFHSIILVENPITESGNYYKHLPSSSRNSINFLITNPPKKKSI